MQRKSHRNNTRSRIYRLRRLVGWTQFDLAKNARIGRTRLSLYENGHIDLKQAEVTAIFDALQRVAIVRVDSIHEFSASEESL
jgi:transcriptional regulator with XRE-family HTH domain